MVQQPDTIGTCFGWSIAWFAEFYTIRHLLILGRVTSGAGGELILEQAGAVLEGEFPELHAKIRLTTPDEQFKRHGQAIAAASLPALRTEPATENNRAQRPPAPDCGS